MAVAAGGLLAQPQAARAQSGGGAAAAPAAGPERAPDRFFIAAYDVSGVTRLLPSQIEAAVYPFTGPNRSGHDVDGARKAIQAAYAAQGLETVVVNIPPQDTKLFKQGVVQIAVNEAPVGKVLVEGAKYHSAKRVLAAMPSLQSGAPLDMKALQGELAEANRFPDRAVAPSFKPGAEPGSIDVTLKVQDSRPIHGSLELNNDHSPNTVRLRADGALRLTDLWGLGHMASASFLVAPYNTKQSRVFSGSYLAPFAGGPWSVLLYAYTSNSNVAALGGTNVLGNGYQIGLRGIYRLPAKATSQSISFGLDFKDFKQNIFVGTAQASSTPITYLPLVAEYTIADQGEHSQYSVTLGATAGLRAIKKARVSSCTGLGGVATPCYVDQFDDRTLNSVENFVHVNLSGTAQWAARNDVVAKLSFAGQLTNAHLVSNEQFALGGMSNLRGYLLSEAVADDGVNGQFELQSPSLAPHLGRFVDEMRVYGFLDGGYTWVYGQVPPEQANHFALMSVGGGLRVKLFEHLSGDLFAGVPLLTGPVSRKGDPSLTFQVKSEF